MTRTCQWPVGARESGQRVAESSVHQNQSVCLWFCPDGSPATLFPHTSTEWAPGTSALDPYFPVSDGAPRAGDAVDAAAPDEEGGDL